MENIRLTIYFLLQRMAQNGLTGIIFDYILPHIYIHKGSKHVYSLGYNFIIHEKTSYNSIRCAHSGSWHPFGYFPEYEKTKESAVKRWGNLDII